MQHALLDFSADFAVATGNSRSQAAVMALAPGSTTGGPDNRHRGADQWLFVVSGEGVAVVDGREVALPPQSLVLIERGEAHEIRNTGAAPLQTLNLYVPPAYSASGEALPAGQG